jgi:very-short-patch-repair endonuclease
MTLRRIEKSKLSQVRARQLRRNLTQPERALWRLLRDRHLAELKFRRQQPVGDYIVDFFCEASNLIVELDGRSHDDRGEYDRRRQRWLESRGLRIMRVSNDDVLHDPESVVIGIAREAGIDVNAWVARRNLVELPGTISKKSS